MPFVSKAMAQTLHLQSIAANAASIIASDLVETKDRLLRTRQAQALASLAKAFDTLEDRKRILKGKPMPGSLRPEHKPKKSKRDMQTMTRANVIEIEGAKESLNLPAPAQNQDGGEGLAGGGPV